MLSKAINQMNVKGDDRDPKRDKNGDGRLYSWRNLPTASLDVLPVDDDEDELTGSRSRSVVFLYVLCKT